MAVKIAKGVVSSPKAMSMMAIWGFGIFCLLYAAAPAPTSEAEREEFRHLLDQSNAVPGYDEAYQMWSVAQHELYQQKGWFWWLSSTNSAVVNELQAKEHEAHALFAEKEYQREQLKRDAFNIVGLFSEFGVQEARDLFWNCLEKGKGFAKRSTFYDMLFGVVMGRDENLGAFLMRVIMNFAINCTFGLIGALLAFMYYLWGMVIAYKASFFSGLLFFSVALLAGVSMCALYAFVLWGTLGAAGYSMVYTAVNNQRIQGGRMRQQPDPRFIRQRPHFE